MHNIYSLHVFTVDLVGAIKEIFDHTRIHGMEYFLIELFLLRLTVPSKVFQSSSTGCSVIQHLFWHSVVRGSEMHSVNTLTQNPYSSAQITGHSDTTVPSFAEKMLQNATVQKLKCEKSHQWTTYRLASNSP